MMCRFIEFNIESRKTVVEKHNRVLDVLGRQKLRLVNKLGPRIGMGGPDDDDLNRLNL
jgi:hypothetical protein